MQDVDAEKRVQKMVAAIKQEASEKAQSIRDGAQSQFNIDKNRIYIQEKEKIQQDYKDKLEQYSVQKRIERSARVNEQRLAKMRTRYELITKLKDEVKQNVLEDFNKNQDNYKTFLKNLIVEAMIKLIEKQVDLRCLEKDVKLVESIKGECEKEYTRLIQEKTGVKLECTINVNKNTFIDSETKNSLGGVILSCFDGRIECANTVEKRIDLCFQEMLPLIRSGIFKSI